MNKQEAAKIIALTLAENAGASAPNITDWAQAKELADKFEEAGHIKPEVEQEELTVYGYTVVNQDGNAAHGGDDLLTQQEAIDNATEWTKDAQNSGINCTYRVAAIVDQGGL